MPAQILDSYALLAYLRDEPGAETVQALLEKGSRKGARSPLNMSEVSYAEVKSIILQKGSPQAWADVSSALISLPIEFHPVTRELADIAADFRARHRISLTDAFAAALAKYKKGELVTGNSAFKALNSELKITWLGQ